MNTLLLKKTFSLTLISILCLGSIFILHNQYQQTIKQNKINYENNHLIGYFLTDEIKQVAPKKINQPYKEDWLLFCSKNNKNPNYLVIKTQTNQGYNGIISFFITINLTEKRIVGLMPSEHKETPGLGDQISPKKSNWYQQFNNIVLNHQMLDDLALPIYQGKIDAITGATITSKAIISAVKSSVSRFLNDLHKNPYFISQTC